MTNTTSFFSPSEANIELLRQILSQLTGNIVTFEDAEEVGIQLLSFYECIARDRNNKEVGND